CLATDFFIRSLCWHPDGRTLYCCGSRGITTQLLRVDTATGSVALLTNDPGVYENLRVSGDRILCTYRTPTSLPELLVLSLDGRERRPLTTVSDRLRSLRLAEVERVEWPAPDGLRIQGFLVKPPGYTPARRHPTIVDLHGGPVGGLQAE